MPGVSVIVPSYNSAPYLGQAIDSLLAQTRLPDQIVIVNDGSTDDTPRVVARYCDPRIEYVEQANKGISAARNRGLSLIRGDYTAFLDADDRWHPTMLEKQLAVLEADPSIVCSFTNFERFEHETGEVLHDQFRWYRGLRTLPAVEGPIANSRILAGDAFTTLMAFSDIPAFMQVMLFRWSLVRELRFQEHLYLGEDTEFALRSFMKGRVAYIDEVLADVRRHGSNTTRHFTRMPIYKLQALQSIGCVVAEHHRHPYHDRLIRAYVDAALAYCRRGDLRKGLATYREGLAIGGSPARKTKGAVRIMVTCLPALFTARQRTPSTRFGP